MNHLSISFRWSSEPRTCFRCVSLGLPLKGIPAGEKHVVIVTEFTEECACADCYRRLLDEVLGLRAPVDAGPGVWNEEDYPMDDNEGEEWKMEI